MSAMPPTARRLISLYRPTRPSLTAAVLTKPPHSIGESASVEQPQLVKHGVDRFEGPAVDGGDAVGFQRRQVILRPIPLMSLESVVRVAQCRRGHERVPFDLGQDRSG